MRKKIFILSLSFLSALSLSAQVDYSVISVDEEAFTEFTQITTENDYVWMPKVTRSAKNVNWLTNRVIDISVDGKKLAFLSEHNNTTNIFIKEIDKQGISVQRTNRNAIIDFSYSPDGQYICFSEKVGNSNQIFQTSSTTGYVCRQITNNNKDYSPIYSPNMDQLFFTREESRGVCIWSFNINNNYLANYTNGMNPFIAPDSTIIFSRMNSEGRGEIWKLDYQTGIEECILTDLERSFTSPSLSPDGRWILMTGSNALINGRKKYYNTDIFVCSLDGTDLRQLTYHAADDLSPVWSKGGEFIYFISQRGSIHATANVWRMSFGY